MSKEYFKYGEKELNHLCLCDEKMKNLINQYGFIKREVFKDFYFNFIYNIISQQISLQAKDTIIKRLIDKVNDITVENIINLSIDEFKELGISNRKANYILEFSDLIINKEIDLDDLKNLPTDKFIEVLTKCKGVGIWTAEMLLIFTCLREDILSYNDYGIRKGICLLYGLDSVSKKDFEYYKELYSPYGTVASFYLWELASKTN